MDQEFKPTNESYYIRLLWLAFPPLAFYILHHFGQIPEPHGLLSNIIVVGTMVGVFQAIWLNYRVIRFHKRYLSITDFFGRTKEYSWKLIKDPSIESTNRWLAPNRKIFTFNFLDQPGRIRYHLSELSAGDAEKAVGLLKLLYPDLREVEL